MKKNRLTGDYYFKQSLFGLILMVGYYVTVADFVGDESPDTIKWRKALSHDLITLKFKL